MEQQKFIAYLRRSKKEQTSSLGLDAQKVEVDKYLANNNGVLINTYVEIESGTSKKLNKRTVIWQAIDDCKENGAILIIAKLDRLARDVEFTSKLMNSGIKFIACDIPGANEFTIHVMAAVAEQEAKRISERTKAALAERKRRGLKLGFHAHKTRSGCPFDDDARKRSIETRMKMRKDNPNNKRAVAFVKSLYEKGFKPKKIVEMMNESNFRSPRNKAITYTQVCRWIKVTD